MGKLVVATNENDILARFWKTGRYEKETGAEVKETLSPAMDILVSSNFERLLWYFAAESGGKADASATLKGWMDQLKKTGSVDVGSKVLDIARRDFIAERVDDEQVRAALRPALSQTPLLSAKPLCCACQISKTIQQYYEKTPSYVADPHTAVGLKITQSLLPSLWVDRSLLSCDPEARPNRLHLPFISPSSNILITLSTAHPAKFLTAVQAALPSLDFDGEVMPVELRGIEQRERRVEFVNTGEKGVREVVERYAAASKGGKAEVGVKVDGKEGDEMLVPAA